MSNYRVRYETMTANEANRLRNEAGQAANLRRENGKLQSRVNAAEAAAAENARRANQLDASLSAMNNQLHSATTQNAALRNSLAQTQSQIAAMHTQHRQDVATLRNDFTRTQREADRRNREAMVALERRHDTELRNMESRHTTDMRNMESRHTADMRNMEDARRQSEAQMRTDFNNAIAESNARNQQALQTATAQLHSRISSVQNTLNSQIAGVQNQVNSLQSHMQNLDLRSEELRQRSTELRNSAQIIINETAAFNAANQHNWYADDYAALQTLLAITDDALSQGILGAGTARSNSLQLIANAQRWALRVHAAELEWQAQHDVTDQAIVEAEVDAEAGATLQFSGDNGNPINLDVNYWTNGDYQRICDNIAALRAQLKNPSITPEQMEGIRALAAQYRHELAEAGANATLAFQLSIDREDLLRNAMDRLQERNFMQQEWAARYGNDPRTGFRIYAKDPATGMEIVLTAEPEVHDGVISNRFSSDIIADGSAMHNAEMVDDFNARLMDDLSQGVGITFTPSRCERLGQPIYDPSLCDQDAWVSGATQTTTQTTTQTAAQTATPAPAAPAPAAPQRRTTT